MSLFSFARAFGEAIQREVKPGPVTLVGTAYKGIPFCVSTAAWLDGKEQDGLTWEVDYVFNRKESKHHGEGGLWVGRVPVEGQRLILMEDVITAGTAVRQMTQLLESRGARLESVFLALDRQEKGPSGKGALQELSDELGVPVFALATMSDLLARVEPSLDEVTQKNIQLYREKYGA